MATLTDFDKPTQVTTQKQSVLTEQDPRHYVKPTVVSARLDEIVRFDVGSPYDGFGGQAQV